MPPVPGDKIALAISVPPEPVVLPVPTCISPAEGLVMLALPARLTFAKTKVPVLEPDVPLPKFNVAAADRESPTSAFHDSGEPAVRDTVVNAPVVSAVAPTVPLMFIDAVPVRLVTTPLLGVPKAGVTRVGLVDSTMLPVPVTALFRVMPP